MASAGEMSGFMVVLKDVFRCDELDYFSLAPVDVTPGCFVPLYDECGSCGEVMEAWVRG